MQRPTTFGELLCRLTPPLPEGAYHCTPLVATAVEMSGASEKKQPFWVLIHSVTDRGLKLLHAHPLRRSCLSLRIEGEGGEVVQVLLTTGGSEPKGKLYETQAEFQQVGLDVGSTA